MTLTEQEKQLIRTARRMPQSIQKFAKVISAMITRSTEQERADAVHYSELTELLGIHSGRHHENAMRKAAAMVVLRRAGWSHNKAQRATGLRSKCAGMSIRSLNLHEHRMEHDISYATQFIEVKSKLGEWLRDQNQKG